MPKKNFKKEILLALKDGTYQHEARGDIAVKNLLAMVGISSFTFWNLIQDPNGIERLLKARKKADSEYFQTDVVMPKKRFSMKVSEQLTNEMIQLERASDLNTTDLLRSVVVDIQSDILEKPKKSRIKALQYLDFASD